jgi:hypothetical protein
MADMVEEDDVLWFKHADLMGVLDDTSPIGSDDFKDGWHSLAGYLRLEFSE